MDIIVEVNVSSVHSRTNLFYFKINQILLLFDNICDNRTVSQIEF